MFRNSDIRCIPEQTRNWASEGAQYKERGYMQPRTLDNTMIPHQLLVLNLTTMNPLIV